MIYSVHSKKFQSCLRVLTKYERVKLAYDTEIDKARHRQLDEETKELKQHYSDRDRALELYMQTCDLSTFWKRKVDAEKQQRY
jgi:hypothetical protein